MPELTNSIYKRILSPARYVLASYLSKTVNMLSVTKINFGVLYIFDLANAINNY